MEVFESILKTIECKTKTAVWRKKTGKPEQEVCCGLLFKIW